MTPPSLEVILLIGRGPETASKRRGLRVPFPRQVRDLRSNLTDWIRPVKETLAPSFLFSHPKFSDHNVS